MNRLFARPADGEAWLSALIAALCFLACAAGLGALAAERAATGWTQTLGGETTILVRPRVNETGPAAAARAAEVLAGVDGVSEARVLDREQALALLRPWLGEAALDDLPLPQLATARLDPANPASPPSLSRALADAGLDATVDDHGLWREDVERAARTASALALGLFLLLGLTAAATVFYAARISTALQDDAVAALATAGAARRRITGLLVQRAALNAAFSAAGGSAIAVAGGVMLRALGGPQGLTPALPVAWSDLAFLAACPLIAAAVAAMAVFMARRGGLGRASDAR